MADINNTFFELIQVALGTRICLSHTPTADEWGELYTMAKKQSLVGVCFAGVQKLATSTGSATEQRQEPSEMLYLTWMGMAAKIQQRNEVMNHRCVELQTKLRKDGFPNCILKGQGIGALYGSLAMLRQSGDIDVWIDAEMDSIIKYVKEECPNEVVDICSQHIEFRLFEDVEVEAHFKPASIFAPILCKRMSRFYGFERSSQMQNYISLSNGSAITVPDNKFQVIHILNHAFTHFIFEGVGLRQVMDYFFAIKQPLSGDEMDEIITLFKKTGLYRFASGLSYVVKVVFNYDVDFIPANKTFGEIVLASIIDEGNFGKYDNKRDESRMKSSLYRYTYHTKRQFRFMRICPLEVLWHPVMRIKEYTWRLCHGYFKE